MDIVDAQIHMWEADHPGRPWDQEWARPRMVFMEYGPPTIERVVGAMDAVGVDAAVVTAFLIYRGIDYPVEAHAKYPERFRIVAQIDLRREDLEQQVQEYRTSPGVAGVRVALTGEQGAHYERLRRDGAPFFDATERYGLPVMMLAPNIGDIEPFLRAYPEVQFVIDHLGVPQGPAHPLNPIPDDPFERLDSVLALARYENVAVKVTGVPSVAKTPYPFPDLWPHLERVLEAYGVERLMWGSDYARTGSFNTYAEALMYVRETDRLSSAEKEALLGKTIRRILKWPAPASMSKPAEPLVV